jgi:glucose/mannose-6-phosphate isomerase
VTEGTEPQTWLHPDSEDLLGATASLGDQIGSALASFAPIDGLPGLPGADGLTSVVVAGMGGSAVAGEILRAYAAPRSKVPVVLVNDYSLPGFVGPGTLWFAVSFSGGTEETAVATAAALKAGAHVVAVTSGGALSEMVRDGGGSVILIQPGVTQPRSAVGATAVPLLLVCEQLGLVTDARAQLEAVVAQLSRRRSELESGAGLAADIARRIGRTIPVFHAGSGLPAVAARRWKTQLNENAKSPAYFGVQPEVCHNEVCGFGQHGDVTRQVLTLVNLRTGSEDPRIVLRFQLFAEATEEALARVIEVEAAGDGELACFFDLVMVGDFVSLHLATRDGIDPGPVPTLTELKRRLASGA